jgi:hypothetical protein
MHQDQRSAIHEFLEKYRDHLTAIGVLAGLVALLSTLQSTWLTYGLSFCLTTIIVIVWSDIKMQKGVSETDLKFHFLKVAVYLAFALFALNLLLSFRIISWMVLTYPVGLMMITVIVKKSVKSDWLKNLYLEKSLRSKFLLYGFFVLCIVVTCIVSVPVAALINTALDQIDHKKAIQLY